MEGQQNYQNGSQSLNTVVYVFLLAPIFKEYILQRKGVLHPFLILKELNNVSHIGTS